MDIAGIVMAGGKGSRLGTVQVDGRSVTAIVPKPMVPLFTHDGKQVSSLDFALSSLVNSGIVQGAVLVEYLNQHIEPYVRKFSEDHGVDFIPLRPNPRETYKGTFDAVMKNQNYFRHANQVAVMAADHVVYPLDLAKIAQSMPGTADVALVVHPTTVRYARNELGTVLVDQYGKVLDFREKNPEPILAPQEIQRGRRGDSMLTLANTSIYIFAKEALEWVQKEMPEATDFGREVLPGLMERGVYIHAVQFDGIWRDVGTFQSYMNTLKGIRNGSLVVSSPEWPLRVSDKTDIYKASGLLGALKLA